MAEADSSARAGRGVLIAEGGERLRKRYGPALEAAGYRVEKAFDAYQGLRSLMQRDFGAVLTDLQVPGIHGLLFVRELRRLWPWVGVVVVPPPTLDEQALSEAAALGVAAVQDADLDPAELCRRIEREAGAAASEAEPDGPRLSSAVRRLTALTGPALCAGTLVQAAETFVPALNDILGAEAVALIAQGADERLLRINLAAAVPGVFLERVRREALASYEALSGLTVDPASLRVEITGQEPDERCSDGVGSVQCVPVILEEEIGGLLAVARRDAAGFTRADTAAMCQAAEQLAAALTALRGMRRLAVRDALTGTLNRMGLEDSLERSWLISRRYGYSMAVVVVDIDHFKTLNDAYGHSVGDEVICEFARLLRGVARASDIIARYGGDEFVAVLPRADDADALTFGERLLNTTRDHVFCESSHGFKTTISVGIATSMNPTAPATGAMVLHQADRAMYIAKRGGRNRVCVWPEQTYAVSAPASQPRAPREQAPAAAEKVSRGRVMVVDDEEPVRKIVSLMLRKNGYRAEAVGTVDEAVNAIRDARHDQYDVVLTDLNMPGRGGISLLNEIDAVDETIVKIVITGFATVDNAVSALRQGAYDFIEKPVQREQLLAVVNRAAEYRRLRVENTRYHAHLEELVRERSTQLAASLEEIKRSHEFTLEAMVAMLDARENQAAEHSLRVRELTTTLGRAMGIGGKDLDTLAHGALLHDIGKICIADSVLLKPGPLLPAEWEAMRKHPEEGYRILRSSPYLQEAAQIVREHHERYDGSGYPRGLVGPQICLGARVFAVVDAYEAMRSSRVYREAMTPEAALAELRGGRGTQFDPVVVDEFIALQPEMEGMLSRRRRDATRPNPDSAAAGAVAGAASAPEG